MRLACGAGGVLILAILGGAAIPDPAPAAAAAAWSLVYDRVVARNQDLYLAPAGGGPERRITEDPAEDMLPRFTRDGRRIVFTSKRSGNWQLWEVPAGGGPARRLRQNAAVEWQADPSPDGGSLAFLSNLDGAERLWLMELASGRDRVLIRHGRTLKGSAAVLGNPQWSPSGDLIAFSSNADFGHQIYTLEVASRHEARLSPLASGGCEPRFRPDGRALVYVSRRLWRTRSRLVEQDLRSGAERVLVDWPALNYDPVYSPDGSELAFASNIAGDYAIYRQRLADAKAWRVTSGPGAARNPDYQPY